MREMEGESINPDSATFAKYPDKIIPHFSGASFANLVHFG